VLIEPNAPDVLLLELFEGADQVDDAGDADVLGGPGGGFYGHGAEGRGSAFGEHDAVNPGGVGGAEQRTQVLRVFNAIEGEQQAGFRAGQQVFQIKKFAGADNGDDSLMGGGAGQPGQLFTRLKAQPDGVFAGGVDDFLQPGVMTFTGNAQVVELAAAGAESLLDRVQAVQDVHGGSLPGGRGWAGEQGCRNTPDLNFSCAVEHCFDYHSGMGLARNVENLVAKSVFPGGSSVSGSEMSTSALRLTDRALADQARAENMAVAQGLKRHDAGLVDRLIVQYQHRLMRYLLFLTGDREMAEDLFQETWMKVLTRGSQYNGAARFDTWLFTVARNLLIDLRRKRTMSSLEDLCAGQDEGFVFEIPSGGPNPFDHCRSREEARKIAAALLLLDPLHREVLALRFHEELSLEEIAKVTHSPLSTVKSRLYRGMAALKPHLEKEAQ
jgi:RNA polymerase sigma-70 factor, ECF subfamily